MAEKHRDITGLPDSLGGFLRAYSSAIEILHEKIAQNETERQERIHEVRRKAREEVLDRVDVDK